MTSVLLVHAVSLWRASLACLLGQDGSLVIRATDKGGVKAAVAECPPDVVVTDLECPHSMEVLTFMEALRADEEFRPGLVVLARADRTGDLRRAGDAGATGYVDKLGPVGSLGAAVSKVAAGGRHIDESLAFGLLRASEVPLSPRELRVLELAAEGESVTSIASALHLASGTVRNYLAAAIRKTGGRNRLDAIRLSRDFGWL
ncbi:response regulator transcription factor [Streptomyces sp. NPDC006798]|uniref:response regulator transcription factor n=1 Tax=Streptomyces sp. NPDC006798 TaxID=3155462 RepID=UPI0033EB11FD